MAICLLNPSVPHVFGLIESLGSAGVSLRLASGSQLYTENCQGRLDLTIRNARLKVLFNSFLM